MADQNPFVFYSMDKTNGRDHFCTHTVTVEPQAVTYHFEHTRSGVLHQERLMVLTDFGMTLQVLDCSGMGKHEDGYAYHMGWNESGAVTDYQVQRYRRESGRFGPSLPRQEIEQITIPGGKCTIGAFGNLIRDLDDRTQNMLMMLNTGQDIALAAFAALAPVAVKNNQPKAA